MAHSPSLKKCFISHKKVQSGVIHQEFWQHVSFQLITAIHCQSANAMISKSSWLHSLIPNGQWQHQNVSKWVIWIAFCLVLKNASGTASPCQPHNTGLARRGFVRRCFWCGTHWLLLFSVRLTCSWVSWFVLAQAGNLKVWVTFQTYGSFLKWGYP